MKNFLYWLFFSLVPLGAVAWLSNLLLGPAIFRMNDDAIILRMSTEKVFEDYNSMTVYTSTIYGKLLNILDANYPLISWHGVIQVSLLTVALSIVIYTIFQILVISFNIKFSLIVFITIYFFWYVASPTYTMTSIMLGFAGFVLLMVALTNHNNREKIINFFLSIFFQFFAFILRPDGYYLAILLSIGLLVFLVISNKNRANYLAIFVNLLLLFALVILNQYEYEKSATNTRAWKEFISFNSQYSKLKTNPAELDLYEEISKRRLNNMPWDEVDALVFQTNSFFDPVIFSAEYLLIGTSQIEESFGYKGLKKRGTNYAIERSLSYLEESKFLFYGYLFMLFIVFFVKIAIWKRLLVFIIGFVPLVSVFLYLGGASRLPLRVHLPAIVFAVFIWALLLALIIKHNQRILSWVIASTIIIFSSNFLFFNNNIFMVKEENAKKISNLSIIQNTMTNINPNGIFIGQIMAFSESATFAYRKMSDSEVSYLTSGWHTFSPPWYEDLYALNLIQDSPYLALAGQPGVYWVSDLYTAQVLDMYMNNHEIIRKNLCLLADLPYGLGVFTFQSEQVCF
jgi:hypothetical protein